MGARGAAAHPLYGRHADVKSFALRQLLRCRLLRHLRSADSRLESRGARFRRGNRRAREGEQGRQGATRGWGVVLKGLGCVWRLSAAAKRCRRWMCDPDAAAECLNAASCAARNKGGRCAPGPQSACTAFAPFPPLLRRPLPGRTRTVSHTPPLWHQVSFPVPFFAVCKPCWCGP